jgi:hypothetical protein
METTPKLMTALGQEGPFEPGLTNVRFAPKASLDNLVSGGRRYSSMRF